MAFSKTKLLWTLFLLGTALDMATTVYLVGLYGVEHEANLVARSFMERWGPLWGTVVHGLSGIGLVWGLWRLTYITTKRRWQKLIKYLREALEALMAIRMVAPINNLMFMFTGVALIDVLDIPTLVFTLVLGLMAGRRLWR